MSQTKSGIHKTEIGYRTSGLNWLCDYVAIVSADDKTVDLTSWVTIDNHSGATYKNASLKLLAGDVHLARNVQDELMADANKPTRGGGGASQFAEKSFAEYHLYTMNGRTNVNDNETKQLSLFSANQIPLQKTFVFEPLNYYFNSPQPQKVHVKLDFANSEKNNLGMPMPKGTIRVYKRDEDGALEFIGEDQIDHTPKDERIKIQLGEAFDVVAERNRNSFKGRRRTQTQTWETSIRNHKDSKISVTIIEHPNGDWTILSCDADYKKKN